MMILLVSAGAIMIHVIFTQLGFNFLGAEIERGSNKMLLHNLEEGVIILDNDTNNILYVNEAAEELI